MYKPPKVQAPDTLFNCFKLNFHFSFFLSFISYPYSIHNQNKHRTPHICDDLRPKKESSLLQLYAYYTLYITLAEVRNHLKKSNVCQKRAMYCDWFNLMMKRQRWTKIQIGKIHFFIVKLPPYDIFFYILKAMQWKILSDEHQTLIRI